MNLVVPVVSAILVIIVAIIVICVLRGKGNYHKGKFTFYSFFLFIGTIAPIRESPDVKLLFNWIPDWVDLNIAVPVAATVIVVAVGIIVICVAVSRRAHGPSQTRLRSDCMLHYAKQIYISFVCFSFFWFPFILLFFIFWPICKNFNAMSIFNAHRKKFAKISKIRHASYCGCIKERRTLLLFLLFLFYFSATPQLLPLLAC